MLSSTIQKRFSAPGRRPLLVPAFVRELARDLADRFGGELGASVEVARIPTTQTAPGEYRIYCGGELLLAVPAAQ